MSSGTLRLSRSVLLDGNGNGSVSWKTDNANQIWIVTSVSTYTNITAPPVPVAGIYLGFVGSVGNQQGATWSGNRANAGCNVLVDSLDTFTVQWLGGNPGDTATAVLGGSYQTKGRW